MEKIIASSVAKQIAEEIAEARTFWNYNKERCRILLSICPWLLTPPPGTKGYIFADEGEELVAVDDNDKMIAWWSEGEYEWICE